MGGWRLEIGKGVCVVMVMMTMTIPYDRVLHCTYSHRRVGGVTSFEQYVWYVRTYS